MDFVYLILLPVAVIGIVLIIIGVRRGENGGPYRTPGGSSSRSSDSRTDTGLYFGARGADTSSHAHHDGVSYSHDSGASSGGDSGGGGGGD